jgi:hypothetical protein
MTYGAMIYDHDNDRWIVETGDTVYGLHCGEGFELIIGSHRIPCRLELGVEWYIIMENVSLILRTRDTYKVTI